jgi:prefoldin beta subunit
MQGLQSQLSENLLVKEELDTLKPSAKVYKLVGPVLLPQDLSEAKGVVDTRIGFIKSEVGKAETRVNGIREKEQKAKVTLLEAQQEFNLTVQAASGQMPVPAGAH